MQEPAYPFEFHGREMYLSVRRKVYVPFLPRSGGFRQGFTNAFSLTLHCTSSVQLGRVLVYHPQDLTLRIF